MSQSKFSNAVDAATGKYLPAPASLGELGAALLHAGRAPHLGRDYCKEDDFQPVDDVDAQDLAATGWGAIFAEDADPRVREALSPLLELRKEQAGSQGKHYHEFTGALGYRPGQTQEDFLSRRKMGTNGLADPTVMPYYLLLVGSPGEIGFDFQYEMDVAHAVGRIHFDTLDEYANYAESVVAAEKRLHAPRATVFGVRNGDERNSQILLDRVVLQVIEKLETKHPDWTIERVLEQAASKERLAEILRNPPSLLFTAGHGVCFLNDDSRQASQQGAIVCSDWPGTGPIPPESYYSAEDISSDADLAGLILFQFACFSAATPAYDDFRKLVGDDAPWAPPGQAFLAGLPKRLLSLPGSRGALAVLGHVDRIWLYSFLNEVTDVAEVHVFEQLLNRLLKGHRVGHALEYLNRWHANYAVRLATLFAQKERDEAVDAERLARIWMINHDARNYVILGDPAVRLRLAED